MTEWAYWRRFYRRFNWDAAYKNRCAGMLRWLQMERNIGVKPPPAMVAMNARMILDAHYRGRWGRFGACSKMRVGATTQNGMHPRGNGFAQESSDGRQIPI